MKATYRTIAAMVFTAVFSAPAFSAISGLLAIPVVDENASAGLQGVSSNIINLGSQIDRSISANTDLVVAQLKGLPLTMTKLAADREYDMGLSTIPRGNCTIVKQASVVSSKKEEVRNKQQVRLVEQRRRFDQRDSKKAVTQVALDEVIHLADLYKDPAKAEKAPSLLSAFEKDLEPEDIQDLRDKWNFAVVPIKESVPSDVRTGEMKPSPEQIKVFAAIQARNERMEIASKIGDEIISRQDVKSDFSEVQEFFQGLPAPETGTVSVEELERVLANYRLTSQDWMRCITTDCTERQIMAETALMNAQQLQVAHRMAVAIDKQNVLLALLLASAEESRVDEVKSPRSTGLGRGVTQ